ncbi:MAG: hypothetical protein K9G62_03210, partial [Alphaproteobacteria bacterium]|nr:hypothetical protein [Alphaproteobacteria bacterium]
MDSQWLNLQFKLNPSKTKAGLATALTLSPSAVSKILNGARQIKAQEYAQMRRFFGLPVDGERGADGAGSRYVLQPLAQASQMEENSSDSRDSRAEWILPAGLMAQRTQAPPDQIRIFQVRESLMEPEFCRGQHVLVDLSDITPSPPGTSVVSDGFGHLVRQCEFLLTSESREIRISALD